MKSRTVLFLSIMAGLAILITILLYFPNAGPEEVQTWISKHAIPLDTVEAGHGFEDMQPLKAVIGNARIVAIGEATHGTREFFQFKHRMFEFLVREMNFTVFGMEADWEGCLAIDSSSRSFRLFS